MINDKKIDESVDRIMALCKEFKSMPNQCAYTDSILSDIVREAEKLKQLDESNEPG